MSSENTDSMDEHFISIIIFPFISLHVYTCILACYSSLVFYHGYSCYHEYGCDGD